MDANNCVYRFLDGDSNILYIGKAKNLKTRIATHKSQHHLPEQAYHSVRSVEYIPFSSYMDAGIMERALIAHYKPEYNVQFTNEGGQSIVSSEQIKAAKWSLFASFPDGFSLVDSNKRKRMGNLDKADFMLFDGEGVTCEVYFFKIIRQNHKPRAVKVIGGIGFVPDDIYRYEPLNYESASSWEKELCEKTNEFPMKFLTESQWKDLKTYYNLKMPIIYKGDTAFRYGDERVSFRYHREDEKNYEFDISVLAILGTLELLTASGEIDGSSVRGKTIDCPKDYFEINLSKILKQIRG